MENTGRTKAIESADRAGEGQTVLRVRVPPPLLHQLEDLLAEPAFAFESLEHVIVSALWSFVSYKMRMLRRLREDQETWRP
jgi:hypothetical protein